VGPKLGRPGHHSEVVSERCAAHPSHRGLDVSLRLRYSRVKLGLEVPTLDVELALTRPLHGDAGVLSCMSAVEFRPQVFGLCTPHYWGVHRVGCVPLTAALPGRRSPTELGVTCAKLRRRSTSSHHCLNASGEAAASDGLWSSSLAATNGPFGAGCDRALEAYSAACCDTTHTTTLNGGWREACGSDDATSSPIRWSWCLTTHGIEVLSLDRAQTKLPLPGAPNVGGFLQPDGGVHLPNPSLG
jgi:hypothetical protein